MEFPSLVRQSEGLKTIPNPKDFSLEAAIEGVFERSGHQDFAERGGTVLNYATQVITKLETEPEAIWSRQRILEAFMRKPKIIDFVLNKRIREGPGYDYSKERKFETLEGRARDYVEYIEGLDKEFPHGDETPELKLFRRHVRSLIEEEEGVKELKTVLKDIERESVIKLTATFSTKKYWGDDKNRHYGEGPVGAEATFSSGREMKDLIYDDAWRGGSVLGGALDELFAATARNIKEKDRVDLARSGSCTLEVIIDERAGTISGRATYQKFSFLKTAKTFFTKDKFNEVTIDVEFKPEEVTLRDFRNTSRYLKERKYSEHLEGLDEEIRNFEMPVVELRYFAMAANYFNKLRLSGTQATMPNIVDSEDRETSITELIEQNLLMDKFNEDVVSNNVNADSKKNLYVITGPNNNGKTTYMNAIGIAQAMGQAGLMVTARKATLSPRDNIYTHYIRPGDIVAGESRYANELSRIREIVSEATGNSLVLIDEPCSGTSPEDGAQEADSIVGVMGDIGATTYVTTHFHNLIDTAAQLRFADNLHCVSTEEGDEINYTYKIRKGSSKQSNGTYLARKMGADGRGLREILKAREEEGLRFRYSTERVAIVQ